MFEKAALSNGKKTKMIYCLGIDVKYDPACILCQA